MAKLDKLNRHNQYVPQVRKNTVLKYLSFHVNLKIKPDCMRKLDAIKFTYLFLRYAPFAHAQYCVNFECGIVYGCVTYNKRRYMLYNLSLIEFRICLEWEKFCLSICTRKEYVRILCKSLNVRISLPYNQQSSSCSIL